MVALVTELMDRTRLTNAIPNIEMIRAASEAAEADVVVVDLTRHADAVAALRAAAPNARIVAYGPHVDDDLLTAARDAGADLVLPRSRFFRDPAAALGKSDSS